MVIISIYFVEITESCQQKTRDTPHIDVNHAFIMPYPKTIHESIQVVILDY